MGRYQQDPALALFDFPSASVTCERRVSTNVPLQKLFFLNSDFARDQAKAFAGRFKASAEGIAAAYQLAFGRRPTPAETALGLEFLKDGTPEQYAQVLLSSNEFLFVD